MNSDRIVGIDLGTTNSLVAFMQGETPVVIPGDDGSNLVPSVVALDSNNQPVLAESIRLRNPYVDPLNYLQIEFLPRWRAA